MRKFCFLAVAAAALALLGTDQAKAGGRRTRYYYSYGGTTATQRSTGQAATGQPARSQAAQPTAVRRYSYAPSGANGSFTMGSSPYNQNYFRADRKIRGY